MIIGSCGFGNTGSSVLTDLLREYDDVQVYDDFEYWISYRVDGLEDLEYHLMKQNSRSISSDAAIKRFLQRSKCFKTPFIHKPCDGDKFYKISEEFINEILQISYKGLENIDVLTGNTFRDVFAFASKKIFMPKVVEKITHKRSFLWPCRTLYYSIKPDNFYEAARKYNNKIIEAMGADMSKPICLDQPFSGNAPEQSFPFFDDPYAVVIDRDPRDLYLSGKYSKGPDGKFYPKDDVKKFVVYYKNMRLNSSKESKRELHLSFENFMYEYDITVKKIEEFLKLGEHVRPKSVFKPEKSINNTQLIRLHPEDVEEIKYIEENLSDFLYPFDKYKNIEFTGKPFVGAARKMISMD